jgi:hypothetical protein
VPNSNKKRGLSLRAARIHAAQILHAVRAVVLYRNQPDGWVAEIPAIQGYALMMTRKEALAELEPVFETIA